MTQYLYTRDASGMSVGTLKPSSNVYSVLLAQTTAQQFTVPGDHTKWFVKFNYLPAGNVFVRLNGTASAPDGTIGTESSEYRPEGWIVTQGDTISFMTPDSGGGYVSASLYGIE